MKKQLLLAAMVAVGAGQMQAGVFDILTGLVGRIIPLVGSSLKAKKTIAENVSKLKVVATALASGKGADGQKLEVPQRLKSFVDGLSLVVGMGDSLVAPVDNFVDVLELLKDAPGVGNQALSASVSLKKLSTMMKTQFGMIKEGITLVIKVLPPEQQAEAKANPAVAAITDRKPADIIKERGELLTNVKDLAKVEEVTVD